MIPNLKSWMDLSEKIIHDIKLRTKNLDPKECNGCKETQSCSREDYIRFLGHVVVNAKEVIASITNFLNKLEGKGQDARGSFYT